MDHSPPLLPPTLLLPPLPFPPPPRPDRRGEDCHGPAALHPQSGPILRPVERRDGRVDGSDGRSDDAIPPLLRRRLRTSSSLARALAAGVCQGGIDDDDVDDDDDYDDDDYDDYDDYDGGVE